MDLFLSFLFGIISLLAVDGVTMDDTECLLSTEVSFKGYINCIRKRVKRQFEYNPIHDPFGPYSNPCQHYVRLNQPERRVGNRIQRLTDAALCDRALWRRWYRFESEAGGVMPTECVDENSCGTHAPVWLNGRHPERHGEVKDMEVCVSLAGKCCSRRWFIRVANCGEFYTYLLTDTPGCYMAYCMGSELPCPEEQSSPTGFSPGCSADFPKLDGRAVLRMAQEGTKVVFYCDYEGAIPNDAYLDVYWFAQGDSSGPGDAGEYPIWTDNMMQRRRSILTEGRWMGKMGSSIYCHIRTKWEDHSGVPSPALKSDKYWAGIRILTRVVNASESGEETTIKVKSTVPVGCLPQYKGICKVSIQVAHEPNYSAKKCIDGKMRQVVFGECSLDITPENWEKVQEIKVKAVRDFYRDGNKRMVVDFKPAYSTHLSEIWNNYKLPPVEVMTKDSPTNMCASTGDPHYSTFDGLYYHVYLEGEFVLYKNTRIPIQINTRLEKCGKVVSCNCGVAVMAGDDVVVIDRCQRRKRNLAYGESFPDGWRTLHRHALEQGGDFIKGLKIYEYDDGKRYTVHVPTGAYLDFQVGENWINIFLHASTDDWQSTLGLCGTFDADRSNDFTMRNGHSTVPAYEDAACGESYEVCKFAEEWRVSEKESFFGAVVEVPMSDHPFQRDQQYCKCENGPSGKTQVTCNYHYDVDNCQAKIQQATGRDKTENLVIRSRTRRGAELHDEDDDYFNSEFVFDPEFRGQEPSWPTPGGITEAAAQHYCQNFIQSSNPAQLCGSLVRDKYHELIDACATDIKVSDDLSWAVSTLNALTSECTEHIHTDPENWGVDPKDPGMPEPTQATPIGHAETPTEPPPRTTDAPRVTQGDRILERLCPSDCTRHGVCVRGVCQCQAGYEGEDCSVTVIRVPKVSHISNGGLCDTQRKACKNIRVYGTNFKNDTGLSCIFEVVQVDGSSLGGQPVKQPAIFDTFEEVICPIPKGGLPGKPKQPTFDSIFTNQQKPSPFAPQAFKLSIANNPLHSSEPMLVILYDSKCQECHNLGTQGSVCTRKERTCVIDNDCYAEGDRHPENCCLECKPDVTKTDFTPLPGNKQPRLKPWRSNFEVQSGNSWQTTLTAYDPEGCNVKVKVKNEQQSHLESKVRNNEVHLKLIRSEPGRYSVTVDVEDSCGATYSQNYHVLVKK